MKIYNNKSLNSNFGYFKNQGYYFFSIQNKKRTKTSKILILLGVSSFFLTTLSGCFTNTEPKWKTSLFFNIRGAENVTDQEYASSVQSFLNNLNSEIQNLKNQNAELSNFANFQVKAYDPSNDNNTISQNVAIGKSDMGFVSSAVGGMNIKFYDPKIITLTTAFKNDLTPTFYQKDSGKNLMEIASKITSEGKINEYQQWTDDAQKWNGNRYDFLYETDNGTEKLVNFYRGMILISGDDTTLTAIKKAWNEKKWSDFVKHGIIFGKKPESFGKYILPELLLRQHFNNKEDPFPVSLANARIQSNAKDKMKAGKGLDIGNGNNSNFQIAFDDMNSFAWTHNKDAKGNAQSTYYNPGDNKKLEMLTVTDPAPYDYLIFSKYVNHKQSDLVSQAIINVHKNNKDTWGKRIGYNGYQIIKDYAKEFGEWIKLIS